MKHARDDYNRIQDPLKLIPEDEPVFLLRGQDVVAPTVLRAYALNALMNGAPDDIVIATLRQAGAMEKWQLEVARKIPDL